MVGGFTRYTALGQTASVGDVDLATEDRLDTARPCLIVKRNRGEQVTVFRHGHGRHPELLDLVEELPDSARPVEQGELGVEMQVDEVLTHSHSIVDGGFELMSYTTRLIPCTSLTIRDEIVARSSCGNRAQSAVIPSRLSTARTAAVFS